jgi:hypothetical protein
LPAGARDVFDSFSSEPFELSPEGAAEFSIVLDELQSREVIACVTAGISMGRAVIDADSTMDLGKVCLSAGRWLGGVGHPGGEGCRAQWLRVLFCLRMSARVAYEKAGHLGAGRPWLAPVPRCRGRTWRIYSPPLPHTPPSPQVEVETLTTALETARDVSTRSRLSSDARTIMLWGSVVLRLRTALVSADLATVEAVLLDAGRGAQHVLEATAAPSVELANVAKLMRAEFFDVENQVGWGMQRGCGELRVRVRVRGRHRVAVCDGWAGPR